MANDKTSDAFEHIRIEISDNIGWLTLDRPDVLNALTPQSMGEIITAFERFNGDDDVRVVVITGEGRGFSAGGDLAFLEEMTQREPFEIKNTVYSYFGGGMKAVKLCPKPTIAAVNGPAAGAGCEIALACDFRIASEKAVFRESWIDLGLISPLGGMYLLPRLVGLSKATEILMLGERVGAAEALDMGLVNDVVAPERLREATITLARRLAAGPPLALKAMKEGLKRGMESALADEWEHNVYVQSMLIDSQDYAEGLAAMQEKRQPKFLGK